MATPCGSASRPRWLQYGWPLTWARHAETSRAGAMATCGGGGSGSVCLRARGALRRIKRHGELDTLVTRSGAANPRSAPRESAWHRRENRRATLGSGSISRGGPLCRYSPPRRELRYDACRRAQPSSTASGSRWAKLMMTCGWKSRRPTARSPQEATLEVIQRNAKPRSRLSVPVIHREMLADSP